MLARCSLAVAFLVASACSDQTGPNERVQEQALQPASATFTIQMLDRCEPTSFNTALGEEDHCVGDGKVTFSEFVAELQKKQVHHQWRFQPGELALKADRPFTAVNLGGEEHTFTEVEEFGGGFVPVLNMLSGNPVPAPECLGAVELVEPGEMTEVEEEEEGTVLYQCCIHPWMRTTLEVHR